MIDTVREVETPEGVALTLRTAGPFARGTAFVSDLALRLVGYFAAGITLPMLGNLGEGTILLVIFCGEWLYPVCFEVLRGATPGKRLVGLRVVHDDGTPVGFSSSFTRNTLLAAELFPFAYLTAIIAMLVHPEGRRLGDIAAGTLVIYDETRAVKRRAETAIQPVTPSVRLRPDEQRLLADFTDRAASLSLERRIELTNLAQPLTGAAGELGEQRLLGMARAVREGHA